MIRAIVENGLIRPLDPMPLDWVEGYEVVVDDSDLASSFDVDKWYGELQKLGPAIYEPREREQVQAILREADEMAKDLVRREMGLG